MDFLFFDIECATCTGGGKLCEFGYVLTDGNFNEISRGNFLINPNSKFDGYVISNMLHYPRDKYLESPPFPAFYDRIMGLLNSGATIVGHTVQGDIEHIGDDCVRYGLHFPDFSFVDAVELYKLYSEKKDATALVKMCAETGVEPLDAHSALSDAEMTMQVVKALTEKLGKTFGEMLAARPSALNKTVGYEQQVLHRLSERNYYNECKAKGLRVLNRREVAEYAAYAAACRRNGKPERRVKNRSVAISGLLEYAHYYETLNLIRLIRKGGGRYSAGVKNCNLFISFDASLKNGQKVYCKKREDAKRLIAKGKRIEIISFADMCEILGATEETLKTHVNAAEQIAKRQARRAEHVRIKAEKVAEIAATSENGGGFS